MKKNRITILVILILVMVLSLSALLFACDTDKPNGEEHKHSYVFDSFVWDGYNAKAKYVCSLNAEHVDLKDAEITSEITTQPTCGVEGEKTYTAKYDGHEDTKVETLNALEHNYVFDSFVWDGYTAKAKYVCSLNAEHVDLKDAEITSEITTQPTCGVEGERTYTAKYDGHEDTKVETLNALEHNYVFDSFVWDGYTAKAKYVCSLNAEHVDLKDAEITSEITTQPTCGVEGEKTYTAKYDGHEDTKVETLNALEHNYVFDSFVWDGYTAKAKYVCSLNAEHVDLKDAEISSEITTQPTCGVEGERTYTAKYDGHEDTKVEEIPALEHEYVLTAETDADCVNDGTATYTCNHCGDSYTDITEIHTGHDVSGVEIQEKSIGNCQYVFIQICKNCGNEIKGETIVRHTYESSVKLESTCVSEGVKVKTCKDCGHQDEEPIAVDSEKGHLWIDKGLDGNVRTYSCEYCQATKTVIDHSAQESANLSSELIKEVGEVNVNGVVMNMDENVTSGLSGDIDLSAGVLSGEDLENAKGQLSDEERSQLADAPIYNFTMKNGEENVDFNNGKIKISLPYTLSEGEDVDSISVWYMSENSPVSIKAVYSNGFVTFEVEHFSYYTVVRLTPAQRCELYGHQNSSKTVNATCTTEGYTLNVCLRCGLVEKTNIVPALGHDFASETVEPSCTKNGYVLETCSLCKTTKRTTLPAMGHSWELVESVDATCINIGYDLYKCANCEATRRDVYPAIGHAWGEWTVSKVSTCTENGEETRVCSHDQNHVETRVIEALGHKEIVVNGKPATCTESGLTDGKVCSVCGEILLAQEEIKPLGHEFGEWTVSKAPTCTENGEETRVCSHDQNHVETRVIEALGHKEIVVDGKPATCTESGLTDGKVCSICGEILLAQEEIKPLGHEFGEWTVSKAPTCTENGEETRVCSHDQNHVETRVIESLGHNEIVVNGKPATCTESGLTDGKVCSVCGETLLAQEEIKPLGHDWILVETVDATEDADGYKRYECSRCDEEYTESIPAINHVWELSERKDATCTEEGYEKFVCTDCGKERVETLKPLGHEFGEWIVSTVPTCTENGEETRVCSHDQNHVETRAIEALGHKEQVVEGKPATCTESGLTDGKVCSICGETLLAQEEIKPLGHAYGEWTVSIAPTCLENGEETRVCSHDQTHIETRVVNALGHAWNDGVITIQPTCQTEGEKTFVCQNCQEMRVEIIPALTHVEEIIEGKPATCTENGLTEGKMCSLCGEILLEQEVVAKLPHSYIDGVCEVCGAKQPNENCKHEHLSQTKVNLGDYGLCESVVDCFVCDDCGKYVLSMDEEFDGSILGCEFDYENAKMEDGTLEDGAPYQRITVNCMVCNTTFDMLMKIDKDNHCQQSGEMTISKNDEIVLTIALVSGDEDMRQHILTKETFDLSEYSSCGGIITISKCVVCGDVERVLSMDTPCEAFNVNGEDMVEKVIDGVQHYIVDKTCSQCGLRVVLDNYLVPQNECVSKAYETCTIYANGNEIINFAISEKIGDHNFENRYELKGETCEDGYIVYETCTICGETHQWESRGHIYGKDDGNQIDLSQYGGCSSNISARVCEVCGKQMIDEYVIQNIVQFVSCKLGEPNIIEQSENRAIMETTCSDCGIVYRVEQELKQVSPCETNAHSSLTILKDGKILLFGEFNQSMGDHNFETTYKLMGENCEDGYIAYQTCTICGETHQWQGSGHKYDEDGIIDLSVHGGCSSNIYTNVCEICGKQTVYGYVIDNIERYISCKLGEPNIIEQSENRAIIETICSECGIVYRLEQELKQVSPCETSIYCVLTFLKDGVSLISVDGNWQMGSHSYERTYTLLGETCEDGVEVCSRCVNCGEEHKSVIYGHEPVENENYNFSEYGACDGHLEIRKCVCGQDNHINFWTNCDFVEEVSSYVDSNGVKHTVLCRTCSRCGLVDNVDMVSEILNDCHTINRKSHNLSVGELNVSFEEIEDSYNHNFVVNVQSRGENCSHITVSCSKCGVENSADYVTSTVFEGVGTYIESTNGYSFEINIRPENWGSYLLKLGSPVSRVVIERGEKGETWTETVCENSNIATFHLNGGMDYKIIVFSNSPTSDSESYTLSFNVLENNSNHRCNNWYSDYTNALLNPDQSCNEGVIGVNYCRSCGYISDVSIRYDHGQSIVEKIDLNFENCKHGHIEFYECACGQENEIHDAFWDFDGFNKNEYVDDEGIAHNVQVNTCERCGLRVQNDFYYIEDEANCVQYKYGKFIISCGNDLIGEYPYKQSFEMHKYVVTDTVFEGERNCDNGVTLTFCCSVCGKTFSEKYNHHYSYESEVIDLSECGSVCGGYARVFKCACGQNCDVNLDSLCNFDTRWIGNDLLYVCATTDPQCAFKILRQTFYVSEGTCEERETVHWLFGYNEETGEFVKSVEYALNNIMYNHDYERTYREYDEDGLHVSVSRYTCTKCEKWNESIVHMNSEGFRVKEVEQNSDGYNHIREYIHAYNFDWITLQQEIQQNSFYKYVFEYNFDSCEVTRISYNENGEISYTEVYSLHTYEYPTWVYVEESKPTCTQDGYIGNICLICGCTEGGEIISPTGHNWKLVGDSYVCIDCGLQNSNGASGEVVLEEIADSERYIAGYWKRDNTQFINHVAIILHVPNENGENEIILPDIDIVENTYGRRCYSFSRSQVAESALSLGYEEGSYDVRFTLVPLGADGSYDYSITFTSDSCDDPIVSSCVKVYEPMYDSFLITLNPENDGHWTMEFYGNEKFGFFIQDQGGNQVEVVITSYFENGVIIECDLIQGSCYTMEIYVGESNRKIVAIFSEMPVISE